uniref:Uncharacterized protein n=1 Tax=Romanomermis culicivorax TaxID=13658 RepID=A0A915I8H4_ROMCU
MSEFKGVKKLLESQRELSDNETAAFLYRMGRRIIEIDFLIPKYILLQMKLNVVTPTNFTDKKKSARKN